MKKMSTVLSESFGSNSDYDQDMVDIVEVCDEIWQTVFLLVYGSSLAVHALSTNREHSSRLIMDLFSVCCDIDLCVRQSIETKVIPGGIEELKQRILSMSSITESLGDSLPTIGLVIMSNILIKSPFAWLEFLMALVSIAKGMDAAGQDGAIKVIMDVHKDNVLSLERIIKSSILTDGSGALVMAEKWGKDVSSWLENSPEKLIGAITNPANLIMEINNSFGAPWVRQESKKDT